MPLTGFEPTGYRGPIVNPLPIYGGSGGGRGGRSGGGLREMLERAWALKKKLAEAELRMIEDERQMTKKAFDETMREGQRARAQGPGRRADKTDQEAWSDAYGMAESMVSTSPFSPIPNQTYNLARMIKAIGPQAAHEGLMQSGQLMSRGGGGGGGAAVAPAEGGPRYTRSTRGEEYRPLGENVRTPFLEPNAYPRSASMLRNEMLWGGTSPSLQAGEGSSILDRILGRAGPFPSSAAHQMPGPMRATGAHDTGPMTLRVRPPELERLKSYEKGGTIPKTGPYKLHKGEVVIPRDDVSPALVAMLTRQKLLERANPKGSAPGKILGSLQGGTIERMIEAAESGDMPSFRQILRDLGVPDQSADRTLRQLNRDARGRMLPKAQIGENVQEYLAKLRTPSGSMRGFAPFAYVPQFAPGAHAAAATAAKAAPEAVEQAARGASRFGKYGRMLGTGLAGGAALTMALGDEVEPPEEPSRYRELVEKMPWAVETFIPQARMLGAAGRIAAATDEGASVPKAVGQTIREQVGGSLRHLVRGGGEFLGGMLGVDLNAPTPAEEEAPTGPLERPPIGEMAMGEPSFPEGSYEAASARVAKGDFGTRESPLVLRGKLSDIEQTQRDVERIPQYQAAKRKAETAEQEAESLYTTLLTEGRAFDPEVYKSLADEAKRKTELAKGFRQIMERHEKANQDLVAMSEKNTQAILRDIIRELATGDRMEGLERLRQQGTLDLATVRSAVNSLPRLWAIRASGSPGERDRAEQAITDNLRVIATAAEMRAQDPEARDRLRAFGDNASQNAQELLAMDEAGMMQFYEQLQQRFGFAAELGETMGGQ